MQLGRHIFLITFLIALTIQLVLFKISLPLDTHTWVAQTQYLYAGDQRAFNEFTSGYPGVPPMLLAIAAHAVFKTPFPTAYITSLALLNATFTASLTVICKQLRPQSWWWIIAPGIIIFNRLQTNTTPPSLLVASLLPLLLLLTWHLYEQRQKKPIFLSALLGCGLGLAATLRIDISAAIALLIAVFVLVNINLRAVIVMSGTALATFGILNPFMWLAPADHLGAFTYKLLYHYSHYDESRFALVPFLLVTIFAIISILMASTFIFLQHRHLFPKTIPTTFLLFGISTTAFILVLLMSAQYQALWYLHPLVYFWELMLPLFILELVPQVQLRRPARPDATNNAQSWLPASMVTILFVGGYIGILVYSYFFPITAQLR